MKNWTIKEAVEEINKGNQEAIDEVAKHYPLAFMAIARNDLAGLSQLMGDKFTMNRLTKQIVANNAEAEDAGAASSSTATKETEAPNDGELENMTTKQLMQLCDKRGIKVPHYGKNKQFYLDALQNAGGEEAEAEDDAEEASDDPYEGKSAMELYKLAKKRGLKVESKKKAAVYAEALRKADAEAERTEDNAEDEGWGDEEDAEEEAPKKATSKGTKKAPAKKAEPAEDEDDGDDWDI